MVSDSLRNWFVIHFAFDMIFGIPLLVFPEQLLYFFGWSEADPLTARLVGAALMGIGWESLLGRWAGSEHYLGMLRLKIIWSGSALAGLIWTLLAGNAPQIGWLIVLIFGGFFLVWMYYWLRIRQFNPEP